MPGVVPKWVYCIFSCGKSLQASHRTNGERRGRQSFFFLCGTKNQKTHHLVRIFRVMT